MFTRRPAAVSPVDDAGFRSAVLEAPGIVVVEFWRRGCAPCTFFGPVLEEYARSAGAPRVLAYEIDPESPVRLPFWKRLRILATPTLVVFENGRERHRIAGYRSAEQLQTEMTQLLQGISHDGREVA